MNGYINPEIYSPTDPVGIDAKIEVLRSKLATLTWLAKPFGRAIIQVENKSNNNKQRGPSGDIFFPEITGRKREVLNLMPNDNLTTYSFFYTRDSAKPIDYTPGDTLVTLRQPVSLIVWANLNLLDKTNDQRWGERLKIDLLNKLKTDFDTEVVGIFESYSRVFADFTLTNVYRQFLKPPYWALRIDLNLCYTQDIANICVDVEVPEIDYDGFVEDGIKNLYLFDDVNPILNSTDRIYNHNTTVVTGDLTGAAKSNLIGGGIQFTRDGYVSGGTIDATRPFTIMMAGSIGYTAAPTTSAIISFAEYFAYGFCLYGANNASTTTATVISMNLRHAVNGAQQTPVTFNATGVTYHDPCTVFVNYDGVGNMSAFIYDGSLLRSLSPPTPINEVGYTTNASAVVNTMLTPTIGCPNNVFGTSIINLDVFSVYEKSLSLSEMSSNAARAKQIMQIRNRY